MGAGARPDEAPAVRKAAEPEFGGRKRALAGWRAHLLFGVSVGYAVFHLAVLNLYPIDPWVFRTAHLTLGSVIGFLAFAAWKGEAPDRVPWFDWLLCAASLAILAYIAVNLEALLFRAGVLPTVWDMVVGAAGTAILLELTRRTAGWALPALAAVFMAYAFVGPWMPGVLHHAGIRADAFFSYIYSMQGVFGVPIAVSSTYIVLFIVFAAFLQSSKAGDFFNDLAVALVGWARGGPAKVAVVSGALFGTISGSSVGNVVASGMITIPMMRRTGYDRATAAAIEATSSTGGQITPPIMGAGAFLMAEIIGVPYTDIAIAAIVPTLLFYLACYAHCHLHALKAGLQGVPREELPALSAVMRRAHLFVPLAILVALLVMGYSVFRAGTVGALSAIVASWLSARADRLGPRGILDTLASASRDCIQLVAICGAAGIIVGVIALTGIGGRFSAMVLAVAGESRVLALAFAMLITLVLGMGMPTTAAYAVAASVVAPGLVQLGIDKLVAHLFVFYYAVISAITPPVALASFAAAGMAGADPWRTSLVALKLGLATFIVPFMFVYGPGLLLLGDWRDVLHVSVTAAIGVYLLAAATEGWFLGRALARPLRAALFAAAILLIVPGAVTDGIGVALAALVAAFQ
ncbi:MAG: TRAP transporter permease, partial [Alphaproteobacteria bacterium]|nr:TRAP transporter permease [Alphaproteobacteria bacterium]